MPDSIANRISRVFFWTYLVSFLLVLGVAWLFLEDLEATTLEMDKQAEIEHFLNRHETDKPIRMQTASLTMVYRPDAISISDDLPIVFNNVPVPFEGEMEVLGNDYLIIVARIAEGTFYLAKDLQLFERRETVQITVLTILSLSVLAMGFALARMLSRNISRPLQQLTATIRQAQPEHEGFRLTNQYRDAELQEIADAFNLYLSNNESLIKRERSLVTMASHELRTPISVVLGAVEVLEKRGNLSPENKKTLARIHAAATTMSSNARALLNLVRQSRTPADNEQFRVADLVQELMDELDAPRERERLELIDEDMRPIHLKQIQGDRTMVRMLLHNLISNALNHNQGNVQVRLFPDRFEVLDQGIAVSSPDNDSALQASPRSSGLGLYIVTLICEHLGWRFSLTTNMDGTCVEVFTQTNAPLPAADQG